jgi:hypothetical protein
MMSGANHPASLFFKTTFVTVKNVCLFALIIFCATLQVAGQDLLQHVRGKVFHTVTASALPGASVKITGVKGAFTTTTDSSGHFALDVPVGRYSIVVSFTGFNAFQDELLVVAGREAVLNIALRESSTVLKEVEITASPPENVPGLQSVSIEKTMRVPANFFDPVRMITSYPGVVAASDQNNSIIVRGNSPNGLLWRLNGVDIVNPNHLSNAGTLSDRPAANGGGVNILSAQMLDKTDFYMGAFPVRYGNTLAGVVDMKLRDGNKTKNEFTAQASLIGLDFAAEGPLGKKKNSSFLANYRYSTVGLLSAIGVNFGDEAISFQDFSFSSDVDLENGGKFSFFGLWGQSKNDFNAKKVEDQKEEKDQYDINYNGQTYALGLNYAVPFSSGKFTAAVAWSNSDQQRESQIKLSALPLTQRLLLNDSYDGNNGILSSTLRVEYKVSEESKLEFGTITNVMTNSVTALHLTGCFICSAVDEQKISGSTTGLLLQPYALFSATLSPVLDLNTGIRYVNYTFNNSNAVEPRIALILKPTTAASFNLSYSLTSQLQLPQVYLTPGNQDLGLTRSHHIDLAYTQNLSENTVLKAGTYYQRLFDVPISQDPASTFSSLNAMEALPPSGLINAGTGENYGVDVTVEKYFFAKNYLLFGGSYYDSKFTAADGIKRNTRFNGNYTFNAVYGKEWTKASRNRTIGFNTRVLYLGGLRESEVDVNQSQTNGETAYNTTDPFSNKLPDYFRIDLRLSFRKNKPGYTRTFAIDIQNLTGQQNVGYHYYDRIQQNVVTKYQLGIIPVLVYRIDF